MREIKFRAWDKEIKKMCKISNIDFAEEQARAIRIYESGLGASWENFDLLELMQYTNQKNHKNIEIYEGDYVSKELDNGFDYGEFEGVVELIDGKWVINNRVNHYEELFTEIEQIEILGNIYENPELLKRIETIS